MINYLYDKKSFIKYIVIIVYFITVLIGSRLGYDNWSYYGYPQNFILIRFVISFISILIFCFFIKEEINGLSDIFQWALLIIVFIPIASFFTNNYGSFNFFAFSFIYLLVMMILTSSIISKYRLSRNIISLGGRDLIAVSICIFAISLMLFSNGLPKLTALDISRIYEVRREFISTPFSEYVRSAAIFISFPILIAGSNLRFELWKFFLVLSVALLVFLATGGRFVLIVFLMTIFFRIVIEKKITMLALPLFLSVLIGISFLADNLLFESNSFIAQMVVFRAFLVPAWLSYFWAETFSNVDFLWFSQSFSFMPSPINGAIAEEYIGDLLFPEDGGSFATVGLLGCPYSNMGWFGIVDSFILGLIICCAQIIQNSMDRNSTSWLGMSIGSGVYAIYLASSNMYSFLSSRGFILFLMFAFFFMRRSSLR